jgi:hypothetical protein
MDSEPFFVVVCPACDDRRVRPVQYLGLPVRCTNCGHEFAAIDQHAASASQEDPIGIWLNYTSESQVAEFEYTDAYRNPAPR